MNPLDTQVPFQFEGMNPNPSFSKTKDGPVYRVSFEVTQEQWQEFVNANTAGMIIEAEMKVVERYDEPEPEKNKGLGTSKRAGMLCKEKDFQQYAAYAFDTAEPNTKHEPCEALARNLVYRVCVITTRADLDHKDDAKLKFTELLEKYHRWQSKQG